LTIAEVEKPRILCVDDEPLVLEGLKQRLRRHYDIRTAPGPKIGLDVLREQGPFAVVVSDMRMPEMNGAEFLEQARKVSPDTVRVLLTGYSDAKAAEDAVNLGRIFRFLTKPCPGEVLEPALEEAVNRYRVLRAEKDVLEQTLRGAVEVLVETLALVNPGAFSRANRVGRMVRRFAQSFPELDAWELEVAAMLSQIGLVTLPAEVVELWLSGGQLTIAHKQLIKAYPGIGADLVERVPRFENVAEIIRRHDTPLDRAERPEEIPQGARVLKALCDYDALCFNGKEPDEALAEMRHNVTRYDPAVLEKLAAASAGLRARLIVRRLRAKELSPGMVLHEPVRTKHGVVVAHDGGEVTVALVARLRNFAAFGNLHEPIAVLTPE
jgi:response regulator RpfG family c-di-GMP phosphodiesterase